MKSASWKSKAKWMVPDLVIPGLLVSLVTFTGCADGGGVLSPTTPTPLLSSDSRGSAAAEAGERTAGELRSVIGGGCPYAWSASPQSFPAAGGSGTLVTPCTEPKAYLSSTASWVTVHATYGASVRTVSITVAPNNSRKARVGQIKTGGMLVNAKPTIIKIYQAAKR